MHLFGEGKVTQPYQYPLSKDEQGNDIARLPRFKWGTYVIHVVFSATRAEDMQNSGRILMETQRLPIIIPMWLSGVFDP